MDAIEIINNTDIVEYISQFCDLTYRGGEYWGLSPFKQEKTPSFSVNAEKQNFYDFASGKGGNVIQFVKEYNHCSTYEAFETLRKYLGADKEDYSSVPMAVRVARKYKKYCVEEKEHGKPTILPDTYMELYEDNKEKLQIWKEEGMSEEVLQKFSVRYDPYSNRIVYPVRDFDGKIVNISGRTLDPDYKEKGLRKYTYFKKWGEMNVLFGYYENKEAIKKCGEIIIFEGAKSVMIADSWGCSNCCALLTSHISENQFAFLIKLGLTVALALDKDVDIYKDRTIKRMAHYVPIKVIQDTGNLLDEKMSPVDKGEEIWNRLYKERRKY